MSQLNIHLTLSFEQDLRKFMKVRKITTKAEALRTALRESLARSTTRVDSVNYSTWLGLAKQVPVNKKPQFHSDDDLWK